MYVLVDQNEGQVQELSGHGHLSVYPSGMGVARRISAMDRKQFHILKDGGSIFPTVRTQHRRSSLTATFTSMFHDAIIASEMELSLFNLSIIPNWSSFPFQYTLIGGPINGMDFFRTD